MDEADWTSRPKPRIDRQLALKIATYLHRGDDADCVARLEHRMQRYSDCYIHTRIRAKVVLTPGELRIRMRQIEKRAEVLYGDILQLKMQTEIETAYRERKRISKKGERPSLDELSFQLSVLKDIARNFIGAPPLTRGQKGRPLLEHAVGSFMALFESASGIRAGTVAYHDGVKGEFLANPAGVSLRETFQCVDVTIKEEALARMVDKLCVEFDGTPMRERDFHLISAIEDDGGLEVSFPD